jgi:hypothetical protein
MRSYLQISDLQVATSLRKSFVDQLSLQTIDENIKADLQIEFEKWLNTWTANAYRSGVVQVTSNTPSPANPQ